MHPKWSPTILLPVETYLFKLIYLNNYGHNITKASTLFPCLNWSHYLMVVDQSSWPSVCAGKLLGSESNPCCGVDVVKKDVIAQALALRAQALAFYAQALAYNLLQSFQVL